MTTVVIVEGSFLTRAGIENVIAVDPALKVIGTYATVDDFERFCTRPDLVVLGLEAGADADPAPAVARLATHCAVLVLAPRGRTDTLMAVLRAGARGLVTGVTGAGDFLAAVSAVARGGVYLNADVVARLGTALREPAPSEVSTLARREVETLRLLAQGYTHHQIARRLGLTDATVNTYVKRIRTKLGAGNKAELTRMAVDLGYVGGPGEDRALLAAG
jgi:DNA-binding NarL/FixJ family response regulator